MKLVIALLLLVAPLGAQVNLNTTIPAPQVKGVLQSVNGGTGLSTAGLTGCPRIDNGIWSVSPANCPTSAPFTITSFTGCNGVLELGASVVNPTCSATYSLAPSSANLTNTDGISSPTNLSSPFTSGTITGTFTHSAVTSTTITLTALGTSTQTATQTYSWKPAIFGGVGTTGATSTVTASGTNAVLSTGNSIARSQLGAETVGQTFGPYSPTGQAIYLLLIGGSHTFIDANTGFPMAFNTPIAVTFINANGASVAMFLYQTTNPLTGNFLPKVAS
jgi:hypothetical protein